MPPEKGNSRLEKLNLFVTILGATLALAATVYGFFAYDRTKKVEEAIQSRLTTQLQALELGSKSAFKVESKGSLNIEALSNRRGPGERQFLINWGVSLSNHGNRTVAVTKFALKLYKALLPGGIAFVGELNPPWRPKPLAWTDITDKIYDTSEGGFDHYAAIGPMSPADRRYGEIRIVLRDEPEAWVYATAEVLLRVDEESDKIVEWEYRRLAEALKQIPDPKRK